MQIELRAFSKLNGTAIWKVKDLPALITDKIYRIFSNNATNREKIWLNLTKLRGQLHLNWMADAGNVIPDDNSRNAMQLF